MGVRASSECALVFAPRGRDADVARSLLFEAGFATKTCADLAELCRELELGAAFAIITEEAIHTSDPRELEAWVKLQPPWSDFPFILLTERGDAPRRASLAQILQDVLGNVIFLERPFHPTTLANLARSALRARQRQYAARAVLERQQLLARELHHRTKNLLAVIQSIAAGTFRDGSTEGPDAFYARLHALATAQNILVDTDWRGAPMRDLVQTALGGFGDRVSIHGPSVFITPSVAQGFALLIHELATNAAKYGAFTNPSGTVRVRWSVEENMKEPILHFRWQERGGPASKPPERKGFGSVLLEHAVANSDAPPRLEYGPEGFTYELSASLGIIVGDERESTQAKLG
jgi:two-component sensor histidine kinase